MVICVECKYFENISGLCEPGDDYCNHPNNLIYRHNWRNRWTKQIRHPRKINKTNDCEWYEAK